MAELPAPPAPVVPVVVAEEPAAGVVPADAELQPPPVVEAEVFSFNCFWVFSPFCSACSVPSVYCTFGLFRPLVFLAGTRLSFPVFAFSFSSRIWFPGNIFCFVQFCFALYLARSTHWFLLHRRIYLLCLVRIFLSRVFVALRFVSEIQGFFSAFCLFCLRVCKFPVFFKFGDTAL